MERKVESFEQFECEIMEFIAKEKLQFEAKIMAQYNKCRIKSREFTGHGFYTDFEITDPADSFGDGILEPFGSLCIDLPGVKHGAGFVLFVKDGFISMLEGYVYGDENWPDEIKEYKVVHSVTPDPDDLISFTVSDSDGRIRMGFTDITGVEKIPPIYYSRTVTPEGKNIFCNDGFFKNGYAVMMDSEGKYGLIDREGNTVIPFEYGHISNIILKDILFFRKGSTAGFMNMDQKVLAEYPNCTSMRQISEHVYAIEYNGGEKTELDLNAID